MSRARESKGERERDIEKGTQRRGHTERIGERKGKVDTEIMFIRVNRKMVRNGG